MSEDPLIAEMKAILEGGHELHPRCRVLLEKALAAQYGSLLDYSITPEDIERTNQLVAEGKISDE